MSARVFESPESVALLVKLRTRLEFRLQAVSDHQTRVNAELHAISGNFAAALGRPSWEGGLLGVFARSAFRASTSASVMSTTVQRKARRRGRRPGQALTREEILAQALALLDRTGIEEFSIRRLAESLDVTPMALYHYFESYEDLLRGVVSLVLDRVEIPARGNTDWREAIFMLLVSMHKQLLEHLNVLRLFSSVEYWGPMVIRVSNQLLGLLKEAGFTKAAAARACRALMQHTFGSLLLTATDPQPDYAGRIERVREHLQHMQPLKSDRIGSMLPLIVPIKVDLDREFAFSLDRLIAGLEMERAERLSKTQNPKLRISLDTAAETGDLK